MVNEIQVYLISRLPDSLYRPFGVDSWITAEDTIKMLYYDDIAYCSILVYE